ncbi:MAG: 50S ribosomal protein L22 [Verrucomicrobia bacterium]|nr:50S ribosomal protein L22 [Verrucomicrobiota bacterium]
MEYGFCKAKYVWARPVKVRKAAALMRGKSVEEARLQLEHSGQKAGLYLLKALKSAVANAELQHDIQRDALKVLEVRVDDGPRMKRSKARSRGSSSPIVKRSSHLTVVVGTQEEI